MKIHCFQHVSHEGLGSITEWISNNGHQLSFTRFYENEPIVSYEKYDLLIVMGGPMGVHDEKEFSWLTAEKTAINNTVNAGKSVMGICLGAQLIANVLGARVSKNPHKEIGWFPVKKTNDGKSTKILSHIPDSFTCLHWHGDTFDVPSSAKHLFESEACKNQGFLYGKNVIGLQFHLEIDTTDIDEIIAGNETDITEGPYIQDKNTIKSLILEKHLVENKKYLFGMLEGISKN